MKAYRSDALRYLNRSPLISPTVVGAVDYFGEVFLDDAGLGSVTLDSLVFGYDASTTVHFTAGGCAGLGFPDYIFRTRRRVRVAPGQVGSGSAHAGEQIDWGVLTGWSQTAEIHCSRGYEVGAPAPCGSCFGPGAPFHFGVPLVEDATVIDSRFPLSTTYDLGTWSFDAQGNFEATPLLLTAEGEGGANAVLTVRGQFFGSSLPALPAIGLGGFAVLLVAAGRRYLGRRGERSGNA